MNKFLSPALRFYPCVTILFTKEIRQYFPKSEKRVNYEVSERHKGLLKKDSEVFRHGEAGGLCRK